MTLVELLIGMALTAVVMTALAAFTMAVTQQSSRTDGDESLELQATVVYARVHHYVSGSIYILQNDSGSLTDSTTPAGVLLWASQGSPYSANSEALVGELEYLYYDGAGTLWLYAPIPYNTMTTAEQSAAATPFPYTTLSASGWAKSNFCTYNYVQGIALGHNLSGVSFTSDWLTSTTQRPALEFALAFNRAPLPAATQYDIAVLRAPAQQPN